MIFSRNGHLRILLIEDNKDDEELIKLAIERAGYKIVIKRVETEAELVVSIYSESWDLVICDYLLPHFSGIGALQFIRDKLDDIPFIFLSGFEDEKTALEMLKAGANDFIYKRNLERLPIAIKRELIQAGDRMRGRIGIEKNIDLTIEAWGLALEGRDRFTRDHTLRTTDLTLRLARAFRISGSQFRSIRYGALLHDVGKMWIPDAILLKEEPLLPEELKIMRTHPEIAYKALSHIEFLKDSINIPYCHHEKFDGSGYPRGLAGEEIPFEARIFSIADVWDALTHDRPYRRAWEPGKALAYIREESGKSFDPEIINKFLEVIQWQ